MNWLSAIAAVSKLFALLTGLYRDWGLRRSGAKEARLSALEDAQRRSKQRVEIEAEIAGLSDNALRQRLRQYRRTGGRLRVGQADHPGRRRQANDNDDAGATGS